MATAILLLLLGLAMSSPTNTGAQSVGVCYGGLGNLPSAAEVIELYKANGIGKMRTYTPNQETLKALRGSNIELILDVPNDNLQMLASDASAAAQWVQNNVLNYSPDVKFKYISVGNEVQPKSGMDQFILPAMQNVHNAIVSMGLQDQIKVSTAVDSRVLEESFSLPSRGTFSGDAAPYLTPIIGFLANNGAPLLANVYPYFTYIYHTNNITLPFALFTSPTFEVHDNNLMYQNLFDVMLDALYSALEKAGGSNVKIVVSESGWPSEGHPEATVDNAATYYGKLIEHVKAGTPKRAGAIETYLFAMFDESAKHGEETERHFGLFSPNKQPKYQINFT